MFAHIVAIALFGCAFAVPDDDTCGVPAIEPSPGNTKVNGRIVGGKEAVPNSWPWQVQMRNNGGHYCGASMISNEWVVTAAHCVVGVSPSQLTLHFGRHKERGDEQPKEQIASVATRIYHESYSSRTIDYDVAVLRASPAVKHTAEVSSVCLPSTTMELGAGAKVHVTGWGGTEGTGSAGVLKQVEVPIVDTITCNRIDYYNGRITARMICAGFAEGGFDSCQGDSGGPLVHKDADNKWKLYGIVSWGSGCADPKKPGVYSNVVVLEDWIRSKVTMVERDEELVSAKFRPMPAGAAFREQMREMVRSGEVDISNLPGDGEWLE